MHKIPVPLKYLSLIIVPIAVISIEPYTWEKIKLLNTVIWWFIQGIILILLLASKKAFFDPRDQKNMRILDWYLIYNVFSLLRGAFIAENYWDWKGLMSNVFVLLVPIIAYVATNRVFLQSFLASYIKYALPLFFLVILLVVPDIYGFYLVPVYLLMFFFPLITFRSKILVLAFTLFILVIDLDARSNVIKFGLPILILPLYYFQKFISVKLMERIRKLMMIVPLVLFTLAVTDIFNVFEMNNYVQEDKYKGVKQDVGGQLVEEDLTADTRTFIYLEVLHTAAKYNTWLIGRSPARGNETEAFANISETTGRKERLGNEVCMLNIFMWTGIVGVVFYLLIFYRASYLAINKSNNIFSKMLGFSVAFRWIYVWVEDINQFDLTSFILWCMIGMCFSQSFREMTDKEMKYWILGVFDKKYSLNVYIHRKKMATFNKRFALEKSADQLLKESEV